MKCNDHDRLILFIVGMHRSGTSALTAAFQACGATTGDHVIAPIEGVNDEGFWEDQRVISLNEALLENSGLAWYSITAASKISGFSEAERQQARVILESGFGNGEVELVKDPRLCVTLPLWLELCESTGISYRVCVIRRDKLEVASSLQKRDGFPLSYGYWLSDNYDQQIVSLEIPEAFIAEITYSKLLEDPEQEIGRLIGSLELPLEIDIENLSKAVKKGLRHQTIPQREESALLINDDQARLLDMVGSFVDRGKKLSTLGENHSHALTVIQQRDCQLLDMQNRIEGLEAQVVSIGAQLDSIGAAHSHALAVVQERDKQLEELNQELSLLREELALYKSWKKRILLSLGLIKHKR